nr:ATP-dependent helicase [Hydrococcus sp. Prado102]
EQIKESLAGERMASFLPIVNELSAEYDAQAIAAAALQMVYDQNCPNWMKTDWEVPSAATLPKPNIKPRKFNKNNRPSDRKTVSQNPMR